MEYAGFDLKPVSDDDVKTIVKYTKDALADPAIQVRGKVKVISETGNAEKSPLKNEEKPLKNDKGGK